MRLYCIVHDYHERQVNVAVSFDVDLLKVHLSKIDPIYAKAPIAISAAEHSKYRTQCQKHWLIKEIDFLA